MIGVFVVGLTNAFFSDTETSAGNTLEAGLLDLKIDNESYYNGVLNEGTTWLEGVDLNAEGGPSTDGAYLFFDFNDLKPDDEGEDTISLHVQNDAYMCMEIQKTADDDVTCTGPESTDDEDCNDPDEELFDGELGGLLEFMFWADDGDNVLEVGENVFKSGNAAALFDGATWVLADSTLNIWNEAQTAGPILAGDLDYYIGKAWCFGNLSENRVADGEGQDPTVDPGVLCDGTQLDNASQTDMFLADIHFSAVQARNNDGFRCNGEECFEVVYTASVIGNDQGTLNNGNAITDPNRMDPTEANGAPDWVPGTGTNFYSLGEDSSGIGNDAWVILKFDGSVADGPGDDLSVHEATNGRDTHPTESAFVEVSADNVTYCPVGSATSEQGGDGVSYFDISGTPLDSFEYVRLTDNTNFALQDPTADGFDLDAVDGVYGQCTEPTRN